MRHNGKQTTQARVGSQEDNPKFPLVGSKRENPGDPSSQEHQANIYANHQTHIGRAQILDIYSYSAHRLGSSSARAAIHERGQRDNAPFGFLNTCRLVRNASEVSIRTPPLVLSWAARGGDAVYGKLVNEIVGIADVINDLYAGPRPMLPKSGCKSTTVGAGCDCRPAQHWTSSLNSRSLSPCLAEASRMLPRNNQLSSAGMIRNPRWAACLRSLISARRKASSSHLWNTVSS